MGKKGVKCRGCILAAQGRRQGKPSGVGDQHVTSFKQNGSNGYRTLVISYVVSYISSRAPVTGPTENMKEYGHIQWLFCQAAVPRFQK